MFRSLFFDIRCRLNTQSTLLLSVERISQCSLTLTRPNHSFSFASNYQKESKYLQKKLLCSLFTLKGLMPSNGLIKNRYSQKHFKNEIADEVESAKMEGGLSDSVVENKENEDKTNNACDDDLYGSIDYKEITGNDSEALNKFKLLLLEIEVLRQDGERVPKVLSTESWKELFALKSRSSRLKLLKFLWGKEIRKYNDKIKKEQNRLSALERLVEKRKEIESNDHINYGFQGSTIFLRIYDSTINHFDNCKLIHAMMHSENVVVDCGYDQDMSTLENKLCAKQICYMFAENRLHKEPFNINFCNFKRDTVLYNAFRKSIPTMEDPGFPINITDKSYLDLFPKDKLVYLTPHCRSELKEFNSDDIYIIGALVDRTNQDPLSLAKAKKQGIRMAQLPLDRYLDWGIGTKSLTINQVLKILLDARSTKDWNEAMKHVPRRKVREPGQPVHDPRRLKQRGTVFQPPKQWKPWKR